MRDRQLRERLLALLHWDEDLASFTAWFADWAWEGWREAGPLERETELRLAEYTNSDWNEGELRGQLIDAIGGSVFRDIVLRNVALSPGRTVASAAPCRFEELSFWTGMQPPPLMPVAASSDAGTGSAYIMRPSIPNDGGNVSLKSADPLLVGVSR
jgi:hypothetical protein